MCVSDWCCSRPLLFIRPRKAIRYSMNIAWDWISVVSSFTMERFWGWRNFHPVSCTGSYWQVHCACLQCRRILGGRKLRVYVRTVVTASFVMTEGRLGRVKIVTLRVGARAKEGPPPLFRVSTCAFASKTFAHPKKTPALQANIQGHPTSIFGKYLFGRRFEI